MTRAAVALFCAALVVAAADYARIEPGTNGALRVDAPYSIMRREVTVRQWAAFAKRTGYRTAAERTGAQRTWLHPGFRIGARQPVVYIAATDARAYCEAEGSRLPTDVEWEYAARAGSTTRHYWGDEIDARYLWYRVNSDGRPHNVGTRRPNAWGLYDVEGNVWEWTEAGEVKGKPNANRRGGSWMDCEQIDAGPGKPPGKLLELSVSFKIVVELEYRHDDIGFRCARSER